MSSPLRYRRDFVTNPSFNEALELLRDMVRKETLLLKTASRDQNIARINTQVGVVDGIERAMLRLENMKRDTLQPVLERQDQEERKEEAVGVPT